MNMNLAIYHTDYAPQGTKQLSSRQFECSPDLL